MRLALVATALLAMTAVGLAQDAGDGKPMLVVETGGHTANIEQVLFTPDSKELITVALDKTVRVWDVATGALRRTIRPPGGAAGAGQLWGAALSQDGRTLAVGGTG